jgi:UDP-N-acetylmuramoyl-L-alanyl-D-glutamate--2,6-diaminopimelate ligase
MERPQTLTQLLKQIPVCAVKGPTEIAITGLSSHSKTVKPGHLFIAKQGLSVQGTQFIPAAVAAGAVALLVERYHPEFPQVTQLIHPDVPAVEALLARAFYNHPQDTVFLVGITGTNGKTTTSYLVRHLLGKRPEYCGLIGTVEQCVGLQRFPPSLTTPDVLQNTQLFHDMLEAGCDSCVMETSSHALHQGRLRSILFDVAVFTNLTQDHLDYHSTMQEYAKAKSLLFTSLKSGATAVINADSPYSDLMVKPCSEKLIRYGIDAPCELRATALHLHASGMELTISYQGTSCHFITSLIGRYNVYNLLAAIGVGLARGLSLELMAVKLTTFVNVSGRLESVPNTKGLNIYVDYAHTDDALKNVLQTLQEIKKGRLITVFGCGGDRDSHKRPKMGAIVEALSDVTLITSDNPRKENPQEIIRQILTGLKQPALALVIEDRKLAIEHAIQMATPEDIVLIAGKGHERVQMCGSTAVPFDDRSVASAACQ